MLSSKFQDLDEGQILDIWDSGGLSLAYRILRYKIENSSGSSWTSLYFLCKKELYMRKADLMAELKQIDLVIGEDS